MQLDERTIRSLATRLAEEWGKEATRLRGLGVCPCPCGEPVDLQGAYKPGHDSKLRSRYAKLIQTILKDL